MVIHQIISLHNSIKSGDMEVDQLEEYKPIFRAYADQLLKQKTDFSVDEKELESFLYLCLDYYTYSSKGDVLVSDHEYDLLMNLYMSLFKKPPIIYSDYIGGTMWGFAKHKAPFMVGSIRKVYSFEEVFEFLNTIKRDEGAIGKQIPIVLSPKFDGISTCMEIFDHSLVNSLTRHDGITGQDITKLVERIENLPSLLKQFGNGYLKCELLMPQENFDRVKEETGYKNRRSATSGIVNTPKNIEYGMFLRAEPLLYYPFDQNREVWYQPRDSKIVYYSTPGQMITEIEDLLEKIRSSKYPYRTDGVVIYPLMSEFRKRSTSDVMEYSIAYKVNTEKAYTKILYGYASIGRTGQATPMLHVEPCDVNETVVEDVSLSNFSKFAGMFLHEGETVEVFSAGDVIPQARPLEPRRYDKDAPLLYIPMMCPHCHHHLQKLKKAIYACINKDCPRIVTGRITNFLVKMGIDGISDRTIEVLYDNHLIHNVDDVFHVRPDEIEKLPGFNKISADNFISAIKGIREKPTEVSQFFGALGIPSISIKRCRAVFQTLSLEEVMTMNPGVLFDYVYGIHGFGEETAKSFVRYIRDNKSSIEYLAEHLNLVPDKKYLGTIVFTGFRDEFWENKFNELGIEVSETLNNNTMMVIAANTETGKAKKAAEKSIPIKLYGEIEDAYSELKSSVSAAGLFRGDD